MKKPHLEVMGGYGHDPLWGYCSTCEYVKFAPGATVGSRQAQMRRLNELFLQHFNKVHMKEDANQAAARIVRESTKDN
jgi:hypothetical protein